MTDYETYLLTEQPEPTPIQKQIEMAVTNGLGYDTTTKYVKRQPLQVRWVSDSDIKNSNEGVQIHLAELDARINPSARLNGIIEDYKELAIRMAEFGWMEMIDQMPSFFIYDRSPSDAEIYPKPISQIYQLEGLEELLDRKGSPNFIYEIESLEEFKQTPPNFKYKGILSLISEDPKLGNLIKKN